jgi:hypothetical protein
MGQAPEVHSSSKPWPTAPDIDELYWSRFGFLLRARELVLGHGHGDAVGNARRFSQEGPRR